MLSCSLKKATLKAMLSKEVNSCLVPRDRICLVDEGMPTCAQEITADFPEWRPLPDGEESLIDFYHAAGHLEHGHL